MKPFSKKILILIFVLTLFLGLLLVNTNEAKAISLEGAAKSMLQGIFYTLLNLAQLFIGLVAKLFTAILDFGFQKMDMVYLGWTITRDIVNMFFILGLIVIAFATILRIETYGMKALLPKLILIALLINFSYLACGIIIDASQILTNYFLGQIQGDTKIDMGALMMDTLKVSTTIGPGEQVTVAVSSPDSDMRLILNTAFSAAITFVAGFVLLIGAILLFLRIGALWALIIVAPFAWFFGIFPALKSHNDKWWSEFFKWSFFAPIYVFFIYLVLKIGKETVLLSLTNDPESLQRLSMTEMMGNLNLFCYFVFLIVLLCGAPTLAMSLGIKAAGTVTAFAKGALKGATLKPMGAGARGLWRKFERSRVGTAIPFLRASREAWKLRKEEKEKKAYAPAVGKWRDRLNQTLDHTKTFEENRAKDMLIDEEMSTLRKQNLGKKELAAYAVAARKAKDQPKYQASLLALVGRGDEEGIMESELGANYGHVTSVENLQRLLKETISDEKEAIRMAGKIDAMGKQIGLPYLSGMIDYDEKKKEMLWVPEDKLGEIGAIEAMKVAPQQRWRGLNRRNYLEQDINGEPVKVTGTLKSMLRFLDADDPNRAYKEMPGYNKQFVYKGRQLIQAEINKMTGTQKDIAQEWLDGIKNAVEGKPFKPKKKKEGEKLTKEEAGEKLFGGRI